MNPVIFTCFNGVIDPSLYNYQKMVIDRYRGNIPFFAFKYPYLEDEMLHGDLLNKYTHMLFYEKGFDCILIIDTDCIPLSSQALEYTFKKAYEGKLVGNIQRANHLTNNKHVYAASSYICFSHDTYENLGRPSHCYSNVGDTCEQFTYNAERAGVPVELFMPKHVEEPYNDSGDYWELGDGMPKYGLGTTFGTKELDISYHLFSSRLNKYNKLFFNKCHNIIMNYGDVSYDNIRD